MSLQPPDQVTQQGLLFFKDAGLKLLNCWYTVNLELSVSSWYQHKITQSNEYQRLQNVTMMPVAHHRTCGCHLLSRTLTHIPVRLSCDLFSGCTVKKTKHGPQVPTGVINKMKKIPQCVYSCGGKAQMDDDVFIGSETVIASEHASCGCLSLFTQSTKRN